MRFQDRLRAFFAGRYGVDGLYYGLLCVFVIAWLARLFTNNIPLMIILWLVQAAALIFMIFRCFSRNIWARRKENEKFMKFFRSVKSFFILQKNKLRDIRGYRYRKCPHCKAMLRLPRRKGTHSVVCPRCKKRFDIKIIW